MLVFQPLLEAIAAGGFTPANAASPSLGEMRAWDVLMYISDGQLHLPIITWPQAKELAKSHPWTAAEIYNGLHPAPFPEDMTD